MIKIKGITKIFKINVFLFFFFSVFSFSYGSGLDIKFPDFFEKNNAFFDEFKDKTFEEKLIKLLSLSTYNSASSEFYFTISDVPSFKDKTQLIIKFKIIEPFHLDNFTVLNLLKNFNAPFRSKICIYDINGEKCLQGEFNRDKNGVNQGELVALEIVPSSCRNVTYSYRGDRKLKTEFSVEGGRRLVSGNIILDLWDAICNVLTPGKIRLFDVSRVRDLDLRLIRPFMHDDKKTWYGKKGYVPVDKSEEYYHAIDYIWHMRLDVLEKDFMSNLEMKDILQRYYGLINKAKRFLNLDSIDTFGQLVSYIFSRFEKAQSIDREIFYQDLKVIYKNCLERYNSNSCSDSKLLLALKNINVIDFEKDYPNKVTKYIS